MKCDICGKPIVLVPSAAERAATDKAGRPASYFAGLFRTHAECAINKRNADTSELMRRLRNQAAP